MHIVPIGWLPDDIKTKMAIVPSSFTYPITICIITVAQTTHLNGPVR